MARRVRLVLGGLGITLLAILPMLAQQGAKGGEWRAFGADEGSTALFTSGPDQSRQHQGSQSCLGLEVRQPCAESAGHQRNDPADG